MWRKVSGTSKTKTQSCLKCRQRFKRCRTSTRTTGKSMMKRRNELTSLRPCTRTWKSHMTKSKQRHTDSSWISSNTKRNTNSSTLENFILRPKKLLRSQTKHDCKLPVTRRTCLKLETASWKSPRSTSRKQVERRRKSRVKTSGRAKRMWRGCVPYSLRISRRLRTWAKLISHLNKLRYSLNRPKSKRHRLQRWELKRQNELLA